MSLNASYSKDEYDTVAVDGPLIRPDIGDGNTQIYGLGVSYAPTRNWELGCDYSNLKRSTNLIRDDLDYKANVVQCSVQFQLQ